MGNHKHKHHKRGKGLLSLLLTAFILKIIWNALVPELFDGPLISYLQAILIILIGRLITGGSRWKSKYSTYDWEKEEWKEASGWKAKWSSCSSQDWRNQFEAKWNEMEEDHQGPNSEEQEAREAADRDKEEFKEGFKKDGKFDVNVVDVEDQEEDSDGGEEKTGNTPS